MSKYCPEIVDKICDLVKQGNSQKDSAFLCGIAEQTVCDWKNKYPEFLERLRACDADFKKVAIEAIRKAGDTKDWRAWGFLLERKFPSEWGQELKQKISGYIEQSETEAERKERSFRVNEFLNLISVPKSKSKDKNKIIEPMQDSDNSNKT